MSSPWHDSPKSAYWGGEFGINAQYPSPQSSPAAGLKTANPEYKEYSARLKRVESKDSDSKDMQVFKEGYTGSSKQLIAY